MDRQLCPSCGDVCMLRIKIREQAEKPAILSDRAFFLGTLAAELECQLCGWRQNGKVDGVELAFLLQDGEPVITRIVGGEYTPD